MSFKVSTAEILRLSREVGAYMLAESKKLSSKDIKTKNNNTLVSHVDIQSEKILVSGLRTMIPEAGVLAEEGTNASLVNERCRWIIDPLDGTTNYLFRLPFYCINIALEVNGVLEFASTYHVSSDQFYHAKKGAGAFKNEELLKTRGTHQFSEGLYATGFPKVFDFDLKGYLQILEHFIRETKGIRRLGSAALDLAYLSEGLFQGFYELSLQPWDIAPGILIAREAGLQVTDFNGENHMLKNGSIVAAHPEIHGKIIDIIQQYLPRI